MSISLMYPVDIIVCESIVCVRVRAPTLPKVEFGDIASSSSGGMGLVSEIWLAWDGVRDEEREESGGDIVGRDGEAS